VCPIHDRKLFLLSLSLSQPIKHLWLVFMHRHPLWYNNIVHLSALLIFLLCFKKICFKKNSVKMLPYMISIDARNGKERKKLFFNCNFTKFLNIKNFVKLQQLLQGTVCLLCKLWCHITKILCKTLKKIHNILNSSIIIWNSESKNTTTTKHDQKKPLKAVENHINKKYLWK